MAYSDSELDAIDSVETLLNKARVFVMACSAVFAITFSFLILTNIPVTAAINSTEPHTLTRLALVIYYNAWVFAQPVEFGMMRRVYITDPNKGRVPTSLIIVLPLLVLVGFLLMFFQNNERGLSLVLSAFYVTDVSLWLTVRKLALPMKAASARIYEERQAYMRLEQLKYYVDHYLRGTWQFVRFGALAILLMVIVFTCLRDNLLFAIGTYLHTALPAVPAEKFASLIPGLLILIYVLSAEISSWKMRLQIRRSILVLGKLRAQYYFQLRTVPVQS